MIEAMTSESVKINLNVLLSKWGINNSYQSDSLSYNEIKEMYEGERNDFPFFLHFLINNKIIEIQSNGKYTLTKTSLKSAIKLQSWSPASVKKYNKDNSSNAWANFRRLLSYYIKCCERPYSSQFYLTDGKYGKQFYIPKALDYDWLQGITEPPRRTTLHFERNERGIQTTLLLSSNDNTTVYLGYPVLARFEKETKNPKYYIPLALIPVVVKLDKKKSKSFYSNSLEVEFDFQNVILNRMWMDGALSENDYNRVEQYISISNIDTEYYGKVDLKDVLPIILSYSKYNKVKIDSNNLNQVLPVRKKGNALSELCNTAIIFEANEIVYTKNLINELKAISLASSEELDKTALAYIFREPCLPQLNLNRETIPYISSNEDQQKALNCAINTSLLQLQGPPGTGKSQVAVNIISNCIYQGESVLFTTRNNQAIEAIRERTKNIIPNYSIVNFCTKEDGSKTWWFDESISEFISIIQELSNKDDILICQYINKIIKALQKYKLQYENLLEIENKVSQRKAELKEKIEGLLNEFALDNPDLKTLHFSLEELKNKLTRKSIKMILSYYKKKNRNNCIQSFQSNFPNTSFSCTDSETINIIEKSINLIDEIIQIEKEISTIMSVEIKSDIKNTCISYNPLKDKLNSIDVSRSIIRNLNENVSISNNDIDEIQCLMKRVKDDRTKSNRISRIEYEKVLKIIPAWSTTLLSIHHAAPLIPAIFDQVIIDEASQCDPICAIPALFRAKRIAMIGDPMQFKPISNLPDRINNIFFNSVLPNDSSFVDYKLGNASAYELLQGKANHVFLREHYRSTVAIANYFNNEFYNGRLIIRTLENNRKIPGCIPNSDNIFWVDDKTTIESQVQATIEMLNKIINSNYQGSVGIICPLAQVVYTIKNEISNQGILFDSEKVKIGTSYSFQGGQEDTIIFVTGYTENLPSGKKWYLTSSENRNIYNVTISRAKSCLIIIGDKKLVLSSKSRELKALAKLKELSSDKIINTFDSPVKKQFFDAVSKAGIPIACQHYEKSYYLDFVYISDNLKIDIEIDEDEYHFSSKEYYSDHDMIRDEILKSCGWNIIRINSNQIVSNMSFVITNLRNQIEDLKNNSNTDKAMNFNNNQFILDKIKK